MTGGVSPQGVMNKRPGMIRVGAKGRNSRAGCNGRREPPGSVCQRPIEEGFRGRGVRGDYGRIEVPRSCLESLLQISRACLVRMQGQLLHDVKIVAGKRHVNPEKPPLLHPIPKAPSGDGHFRWRMHGPARIIAANAVF